MKKKKNLLERIIDAEPVTLYLYDLNERRNVFVSRHWLAAYGYSAEETGDMGPDLIPRLFHPDDLARIADSHEAWRSADEGEVRSIEYRIRDKKGNWCWLLSHESPYQRDDDGRVSQIVGVAHDVTDSKREQALQAGQNRLTEMIARRAPLPEVLNSLITLLEAYATDITASILLLDEDKVHVRHGAAPSLPVELVAAFDGQRIGPQAGSCGTAMFRKEAVFVEDIATDPLWQEYRGAVLPHGFKACRSTPVFGSTGQVLGSFAIYYRETRLPPPDHQRLVDVATQVASIAIANQLSDEALIESEAQYRSLFENINSGFVLFEVVQDEQGRPVDLLVLAANRMFEQTTGVAVEKAVGRRLTETVIGIEKDSANWIGIYGEVALTGVARQFEHHSELLDAYYVVTAFRSGPGQCAVCFLDITKSRRADAALSRSEERYALAMKGSNDGVWDWDLTTDEVEYSFRWKSMLGYAENELDDSFSTWESLVHPADVRRAKRALHNYLDGRRSDFGIDLRMRHKDGRWVDILSRGYAVRSEDTGKPVRFIGTHVDISEQKLSERKIRQGLLGTVEAVSRMLEARDPYTHGHQNRVSQLAVAIAREMGLSGDRLEGIRVGASIHDIGKIQVPGDILVKPSKLVDAEYELIKTHARVGYEILRGIQFPWPVAEIAYQHHERYDGSGYPQGLTGDEISLEARIVAVADVIEAMASHRPYRAALGVGVALDEIRRYRAVRYDPDVVDACIAVFDHGFEFVFSN